MLGRLNLYEWFGIENQILSRDMLTLNLVTSVHTFKLLDTMELYVISSFNSFDYLSHFLFNSTLNSCLFQFSCLVRNSSKLIQHKGEEVVATGEADQDSVFLQFIIFILLKINFYFWLLISFLVVWFWIELLVFIPVFFALVKTQKTSYKTRLVPYFHLNFLSRENALYKWSPCIMTREVCHANYISYFHNSDW